MPPKTQKVTQQDTSETETICGYELVDVRKSIREAIDRRDARAAARWTAELVATPRAIGSLWAAFWQSWASTQNGHGVIPILLRQGWESITDAVHQLDGDWTAFRNEPAVRSLVAEMTLRLLELPRKSIVVWPTKDLILYDVSVMKSVAPPEASDGAPVLSVWVRNEDAFDLRLMAGRFITAIETGDLRVSLSAVAWTLMTHIQQGLTAPLKVDSTRAPGGLSAKARASPIWFWLDIGGAWLRSRTGLHTGWQTAHNAISASFREHFKRWSAVDKMRILLAWILMLRESATASTASTASSATASTAHTWSASVISIPMSDVDLPYKEIAIEFSDPDAVLRRERKEQEREKEMRKAGQSKAMRVEAQMAEADAMIMAAMGLQVS